MSGGSKAVKLFLRSFLAGEKCACCGEPDTGARDILCPGCLRQLELKSAERCPSCGHCAADCVCLRKNMREAGCSGFVKLGFYRASESDSALNRAIFRLKKNRDRMLADLLAERLAPGVASLLGDIGVPPDSGHAVVTYVTRSAKRIREEGVDQAELLGSSLARACGLECWKMLGRSGSGGIQKRLDVASREDNVSGMFSVIAPGLAEGRLVILVDDLVTTGSTVSECCALLKRAGAAGTVCAAIAEA